ncbi:hypothetical protein DERF_006592 [Dermatophagoides farinae]|uniref:Uncharacterized protein n=1 Tax=Dermatophagoides farinae TaxID=6954 RepID=A0A922L745_DERFA|nr:hypothetical protein DERF_006592 [Dermatophagoides farinae]
MAIAIIIIDTMITSSLIYINHEKNNQTFSLVSHLILFSGCYIHMFYRILMTTFLSKYLK